MKNYSLSGFLILLLCFISEVYGKENIRPLIQDADSSIPFIIHPSEHLGINKTSSDDRFTFTTGLFNDFFTPDSTTRYGYFYLELHSLNDQNFISRRSPLNISIVIDRSGSMAGDKIEAAKKAAKTIVDKLDSTDFISVVMYDNFINVVQQATPDTNKKAIKERIDKISSRGSTNLWGGTERGYDEVKKKFNPDLVNRVLLLSDGRANVGVIEPLTILHKIQQYRDSGMSISTFGVGLDYNEFLMTEMAESGLGNYYFIDTSSMLVPLFNKELNNLLSITARKAQLKIEFPKGMKIEGCFPSAMPIEGNELVIDYQNLFAGETKSVLIKYEIPKKIKGSINFKASFSYTDLIGEKGKYLINDNSLQLSDIKAYQQHYNKEVIEQVLLFYINENMQSAMIRSDAADYAGAKLFLDRNMAIIRQNVYYFDDSKELKMAKDANEHYLNDILHIKRMNKNAILLMQKTNADALYKIRNKKTVG